MVHSLLLLTSQKPPKSPGGGLKKEVLEYTLTSKTLLLYNYLLFNLYKVPLRGI
jgi:hypothetical protein